MALFIRGLRGGVDVPRQGAGRPCASRGKAVVARRGRAGRGRTAASAVQPEALFRDPAAGPARDDHPRGTHGRGDDPHDPNRGGRRHGLCRGHTAFSPVIDRAPSPAAAIRLARGVRGEVSPNPNPTRQDRDGCMGIAVPTNRAAGEMSGGTSGGGEAAAARQRELGKWTARERIRSWKQWQDGNRSCQLRQNPFYEEWPAEGDD